MPPAWAAASELLLAVPEPAGQRHCPTVLCPGLGLLRVQQEVFLCDPSWPGTRVSFQAPNNEDRSISDASFQVLWDLEPSSTIRRGVFRKCSAPASVGHKVQQNAAFPQEELLCQSRWSATCYCNQYLRWGATCPRGLPAATSTGEPCAVLHPEPCGGCPAWAHTWHTELGLSPCL